MSQLAPVLDHSYLGLDGEQLHIARWLPAGEIRATALLLHGSLANGRSFYSHSGRGLAPFLARHGIACYVPDLRGRGRSTPTLSRHSRHGQWETVVVDIPALHAWVRQCHPDLPVHWLGHSWGGVMMVAALARQPQLAADVASLTLLASKRRLLQRSLAYHLQVNVIWRGLARAVAAVVGYLPARVLRIGADNETRLSLSETYPWLKAGPWRDPRDGFDYSSALARLRLPRCWLLAAQDDPVLGQPADVRRLADELPGPVRYSIHGRAHGGLQDYSHIGLLIHPDAERDHFPQILAWLNSDVDVSSP